MELTSPAFDNNNPIPDKYTCRGAAISPPLNISGADGALPSAQTLALFVHDPDAPSGDFTHWTVWNISATTAVIPENTIPSGAVQGLNDFGKIGYGAPCPPSGTHRYVFELYALNCELNLEPGADANKLTALLQEHQIAYAQLIGTVSASKK